MLCAASVAAKCVMTWAAYWNYPVRPRVRSRECGTRGVAESAAFCRVDGASSSCTAAQLLNA